MTRDPGTLERSLLVSFAALAWSGVLLQLFLSIGLSLANGQSIANGLVVYLGYFTVLTNIFVALVVSARLWRVDSPLVSGNVRGCATTAILLVGIAYHVLLRDAWDPQGWQWVADVVLHYAVPLAAITYWILFPPRERLRATAALGWSLYPAAYLVYALLRGELLGIYPYHFIDAGQLGHAATLANALGLLLVFVALGAVVSWIARFRALPAPSP